MVFSITFLFVTITSHHITSKRRKRHPRKKKRKEKEKHFKRIKERQVDKTLSPEHKELPKFKMMNVEEEVGRLKQEIKRLGTPHPTDGSFKVTFGILFHDERCANIFEALVGTLRAAKKRKIVTYDGELLLQGVHDNVEIILKPDPVAAEAAATGADVKN